MSTDVIRQAKQNKLLYGDLSYKINGVLFSAHNELGRFAREKQYADLIEQLLIKHNIKYQREYKIGDSGNVVDFIIEDALILELKAKPFLLRADYEQTQRYLHSCNLRLGILVNFRTKFLQPKRVLKNNIRRHP